MTVLFGRLWLKITEVTPTHILATSPSGATLSFSHERWRIRDRRIVPVEVVASLPLLA
jgi:hypothetical protein